MKYNFHILITEGRDKNRRILLAIMWIVKKVIVCYPNKVNSVLLVKVQQKKLSFQRGTL